MNKKLRKTLKTIILAAIFYLIAICLPAGWGKDVFYALAYVVSGFLRLLKNLCAIFVTAIFLMKIF